MTTHRIVSHQEWLEASRAFLDEEKEFTRLRDALSRRRRELPWERVEKSYVFDAPEGRITLADLFGPHSQLLVYHFMFGPDWSEGCHGCSFWADNYNGVDIHLAHRDTALELPLGLLGWLRFQLRLWRHLAPGREEHRLQLRHDQGRYGGEARHQRLLSRR
jgi:predicted dithiol-disulfide oxidoreductase (DUF899 family)